MVTIDKVVLEDQLQSLAAEINSEYDLLELEEKDLMDRTEIAMRRGRRIGELLTKVKDLLEHGEWGPWVDKNCRLQARQARLYMEYYRFWDEQTALNAAKEPFNLKRMTERFKEARMSPEDLYQFFKIFVIIISY